MSDLFPSEERYPFGIWEFVYAVATEMGNKDLQLRVETLYIHFFHGNIWHMSQEKKKTGDKYIRGSPECTVRAKSSDKVC